jgi:SNF2 family DNA or RNA helicase
MLEVLEECLTVNGVTCTRLTGSPRERAHQLEQFCSDPQRKVLLMSLKTDSSGLTLVAATHVFLLEPSLNPAVEAQAVNRVHRLGQDRPTCVHRLVVRNSVEESIVRRRARGSAEETEGLQKQEKEALDLDQLLEYLGIAAHKELVSDV